MTTKPGGKRQVSLTGTILRQNQVEGSCEVQLGGVLTGGYCVFVGGEVFALTQQLLKIAIEVALCRFYGVYRLKYRLLSFAFVCLREWLQERKAVSISRWQVKW